MLDPSIMLYFAGPPEEYETSCSSNFEAMFFFSSTRDKKWFRRVSLPISPIGIVSMNVRSNPTKSEVFALGFANDLKIDYIMLSDETATSPLFMNTLEWLYNFLKQ